MALMKGAPTLAVQCVSTPHREARTASRPRGGGRIESIDAVRGLALIGMVFSHGLHWFHTGTSHDVFSLGGLSVGDLATPAFYILAGISLRLSIQSRLRREGDLNAVWAGFRRRFTQLFLIGIPLASGWGVLQAQAVALLALTFLAVRIVPRHTRWAHPDWPFVLSIVLLLSHVAVQSVADAPLMTKLFSEQFPLLAIVTLGAFGYGWGRFASTKNWGSASIALGGLLSLGALVLFIGGDVPARIGMTPGYLLAGSALTMLLLGFGHNRRVANRSVTRLLGRIGRRALYLFFAHYGLLVVLSFGFGWWERFDVGPALLAASFLVLITVFVGLRYAVPARDVYAFLDGLEERWARARRARTFPHDSETATADADESIRLHNVHNSPRVQPASSPWESIL